MPVELGQLPQAHGDDRVLTGAALAPCSAWSHASQQACTVLSLSMSGPALLNCTRPLADARSAPHDGQNPQRFATVGDQLVVPTFGSAQAKDALGQHAALEKGVVLVLDKLPQAGAGCRFGLEEGLGIAAPGGVAWSARDDQCAIGRRVRLPITGLHALLPSL